MPDRYLRGDIVTVRDASGEPIDPQTTLADDVPYIKLGAQEARLFLGADVDQSINQGNDVRASIHALNAVTYFVGDSGRSCKGEAIPSLFRTVFSADTAQPEVEEVLPGVEHVQLQYLVSLLDQRTLNGEELGHGQGEPVAGSMANFFRIGAYGNRPSRSQRVVDVIYTSVN